MKCKHCGAFIDEATQKYCPSCGELVEKNSRAEEFTQPAKEAQATAFPWPTYPMAWYKFLIYFSLFAGAVIHALDAIKCMTGLIYSTSAEAVYDLYGAGLKIIDTLYGISLFVIAVFLIITRFKLAQYKKDGPIYLYVVYIAELVFLIIYDIAVSAVTGLQVTDAAAVIGSILGSGVYIFLNYKYFTKRAGLFVN